MYYLLTMSLPFFLQNLQALMNECIGHVIGKPHSPVTGLYIGKRPLWDVYILLQVYNKAQNEHNGNSII